TQDKIKLIEMLADSGLKTIEATSFVHPKWTPQLADSMEVMKSIKRLHDVKYTALIPNMKGLENALISNMDEVAVFMSSTQSHNKKNLNRTIEESLEILKDCTDYAKSNKIQVRAYLSTVFGCPYEGVPDIKQVLDIVDKLLSFGVYQISLGDTIGIANPKYVKFVLENVFKIISDKSQIALHFHDTRGLGLANSLVGLEMGITTFDSSIGGLGGCPYAPGATGNISTEDLVNLLHSMSIETGVNLEKLVDCNTFMSDVLGRELSSKYAKTFTATKKLPV
ncbi:MAG: hydroxymethylglutaryl-CoA lyase, partial [Candidatus Sericytochromatia bacterium]